jgi:hypothetical protein
MPVTLPIDMEGGWATLNWLTSNANSAKGRAF